jgi:DNA-binding transcriptional regulator YiaG
MIEIGFDEFFLLEKLEKIEYGYLNQYEDFLNRIIGDAEDDISKSNLDEINLVKNTINKINNLSSTLLSKELNYKIKCIEIAEARQSFVMTKSMLAELNSMDFKTLRKIITS